MTWKPGWTREKRLGILVYLVAKFARDFLRLQLEKLIGDQVQVHVRDNNVDQALRALKKKMQREGIFREMKLRNFYEKPSVRRAREKAEAVRRARKLARKRAQREGLAPGRRVATAR
jgi:small subunit ribosomal protein S21